jgi:cytoskeletal protein RodZ
MNIGQKSRNHSKLLLIIIVVVIFLLALTVFLIYKHSHKSNPIINQTDGGQINNNDSPNSSKGVSDKSNNSSPNASSVSLVTPYGSFVSNHHPNLSGSPAPNSLTSTCSTSAGASCQITFTNDGLTKTLPAQVTNSSGYTYWSWTLQSIGLTTGSWKIHAISSYNGQAKTAEDSMDLVVSE